MQNKKYISLLIIAVVATSFVAGSTVFAQSNPGQGYGYGMAGRGGQRPLVVGSVTAINGDSITMTGRQGFGGNSSSVTTYTVDATNAQIIKDNSASTISGISVGDTIAVMGTMTGTNIVAANIRDGLIMGGERGGMGIVGTVASVNGTSLTVNGRAMPNGGTAPTYTVDASSATVTKNGAASSVSNILVGDNIAVQGTVSGTNVTAKTIRDGVAQPAMQGNGQPVVAGKIGTISGNTITITNASNLTYTIDATNSKFIVPGVSSPTISNVAVGDSVVIQGTINGTSVVASSVIDQKSPSVTNGNLNNMQHNPKPQNFMGGVMGGIGNFFKKLFGF